MGPSDNPVLVEPSLFVSSSGLRAYVAHSPERAPESSRVLPREMIIVGSPGRSRMAWGAIVMFSQPTLSLIVEKCGQAMPVNIIPVPICTYNPSETDTSFVQSALSVNKTRNSW